MNEGQDSLHIRHRDHAHMGPSVVLGYGLSETQDSPTPSQNQSLHRRSRPGMAHVETGWLVEEDHSHPVYRHAELHNYPGQ